MLRWLIPRRRSPKQATKAQILRETSTGSQPQGRRVEHSSRENVGKPFASHRKAAVREAPGQPKWTDASRAAMFNPALHCPHCYDLLNRVFDHKTSDSRRSRSSHSSNLAIHTSLLLLAATRDNHEHHRCASDGACGYYHQR